MRVDADLLGAKLPNTPTAGLANNDIVTKHRDNSCDIFVNRALLVVGTKGGMFETFHRKKKRT